MSYTVLKRTEKSISIELTKSISVYHYYDAVSIQIKKAKMQLNYEVRHSRIINLIQREYLKNNFYRTKPQNLWIT